MAKKKRIKREKKTKLAYKNEHIAHTSINEDLYKTKSIQRKREVREIDTVKFQDAVNKVYEMIIEGVSLEDIRLMLLIENAKITDAYFKKLVKAAYNVAQNSLHKDREYTFRLHMRRYEEMYYKSMDMVDFSGRELEQFPGSKDWAIIVAKYSSALRALKCKEDLIGLHDKSIVLEFNENKAIVANTDAIDSSINLSVLDFNERKELLQLLSQSRTVPIEGVQRVTIKTLKIEINPLTGETNRSTEIKKIEDIETYDITFEEMPENVVEKFEEIKRPEEEVDPHVGAIVVGEKPIAEKDKKLAQDVALKINKNLLDSFKKRMNEKKQRRS